MKDIYKNRKLERVAYIAGKRESRRLLGDFILKEQDITDYVIYPDVSASTALLICIIPILKTWNIFLTKNFKSRTCCKLYTSPGGRHSAM
ncbi:MAG: hypothetical protein JW798_15140 [Prolixibacteraceae bacterium]|nr:hypothetical protein [Prolixibacteraceae bacterium]MBN2819759.1 hypothetical protein [Bacteroidales bacterium]